MPQSTFRAISVFLTLAGAALVLPAAVRASDEPCPVKANQPAAPGAAIKPQISLEATPATEVVNFDGNRGVKSFYAVFKASKPLPSSLTPDQIEIVVPRPPHRVGESLESASLPFPTFGTPQFIDGRREIQLLTCIDAAGASAGVYTGQVSIGGPGGLTGAAVTTTINAKSVGWFWIGLIVGLVASAVLLIFRVTQELSDKTLLAKVLTVAVPLVIAGIAMWKIYASDPSWGADPISALLALAGAAFGAVGGGSLISAFQGGAKPGQPQP